MSLTMLRSLFSCSPWYAHVCIRLETPLIAYRVPVSWASPGEDTIRCFISASVLETSTISMIRCRPPLHRSSEQVSREEVFERGVAGFQNQSMLNVCLSCLLGDDQVVECTLH